MPKKTYTAKQIFDLLINSPEFYISTTTCKKDFEGKILEATIKKEYFASCLGYVLYRNKIKVNQFNFERKEIFDLMKKKNIKFIK